MKKPHKIFFAPKKQRKILLACGLSIRQFPALGCWNVTLLLLWLLSQKKCEYHRTCCDYLVAAACQDCSAWNEKKKLQHFYQLVVNMALDLWKSYAHTFRCLALLWWERTSGKSAMRAIVGSNLYSYLLNSKITIDMYCWKAYRIFWAVIWARLEFFGLVLWGDWLFFQPTCGNTALVGRGALERGLQIIQKYFNFR